MTARETSSAPTTINKCRLDSFEITSFSFTTPEIPRFYSLASDYQRLGSMTFMSSVIIARPIARC